MCLLDPTRDVRRDRSDMFGRQKKYFRAGVQASIIYHMLNRLAAAVVVIRVGGRWMPPWAHIGRSVNGPNTGPQVLGFRQIVPKPTAVARPGA